MPVLVKTEATESLQISRVVRQLALEWVQSELPAEEVSFVDCLRILGGLQTATACLKRTEAIFGLVFGQALALEKSSEWLAHELKFETLAQTVACRPELARLYLTRADLVDDDALDLYNERMYRCQGETMSSGSMELGKKKAFG